MNWSHLLKVVIGPNLGLDWAAIAIGSAALFFQCRDNKSALMLSMFANAIWLTLGLCNTNIATVVGNLGFLIFNVSSQAKRMRSFQHEENCQ